ncbi:carbohydrate ABC transporter ATP-binding protein, CUT1 family [Pseudooceanicola antarcticus]|uniref:Carbohydrate ABC transporter ATP-binding protein, CUT1 family n=1 Tax=Pseudooceanicola antarcticus TaxID=1247613 RepID=A0A285IJL2_9RHOB|nr:sn-glycerol-3-phosphate ABC transporter ATP-binding protein UgpC [Pseudooceanicola antarcticus]PJE28812.1 sn-glycerol-3-phosphate ABC transporter ATP-binding protein UgpC [Pseudooceanicola antarcticus]SNY48162.1 carbohydrate ABC transporter ATP-binding protein, CUT1 family [Pseudooceanicola antarcticus]
MGQLALSGVKKRFEKLEVIHGIDLDIKDGEFVVFVGPSGCGKSTLLRMICGLEEITEGDCTIDGTRVNDLPPVKRGIAMVFQSYALYPHMSVFENIAFPLRVEKRPEAEIKEKVGRAAAVLQLENRLHQKPGNLSGGQRQRVAIGRAIVREPSIFLFDEPLSNLDAALRAEMRIELTALHQKLKATMIYVTHDQVEAMTMADRIVVLDGGSISQVGAPLELYHKPANLFVAGFIGNPKMNFIPGTCTAVSPEGATVELVTGASVTVPVTAAGMLQGQPVTLGIRPEHLTQGAGDVSVEITPTVVEHLGVNTVTYADLEGVGNVSALLSGSADVAPGQPARLSFSAADCHLFDAEGQALERRVDSAMPIPAAASAG